MSWQCQQDPQALLEAHIGRQLLWGRPRLGINNLPNYPAGLLVGGLSHVCVILQVGQQGHRSAQDPNMAGPEGSAGAHGGWSFQGHGHVLQTQLYALKRLER